MKLWLYLIYSTACIFMILTGMAAADSPELGARIIPKIVFIEQVDRHFNYDFHILFNNLGKETIDLLGAKVTYTMNERPVRLRVWDASFLQQKCASGNTRIPQGGRILLRGLGEELDLSPQNMKLEVVFEYQLKAGETRAYPLKIPLVIYRQETKFSLPFQNEWYTAMGHGIREGHRLAAQGQSFAWDFTYRRQGRDCRFEVVTPDTKLNPDDFYGFGEPVLAPAPGKIVMAVDHQKDFAPTVLYSPYQRGKPEDPYEILGNYVIIRHRANEFSLLAHLQQGSVIVKPNQEVQRGQVIAKCGNSGDSSYPHIHFQVMNGADHFRSAGLPVKLSNFVLSRKNSHEIINLGVPQKGDQVENLPNP
jgi:hypothetical protein